ALDAIIDLVALRLRDVEDAPAAGSAVDESDASATRRIRTAAFDRIRLAAVAQTRWLRLMGDDAQHAAAIDDLLEGNELLEEFGLARLADVPHLSRLRSLCIREVSPRALRETPRPQDDRYSASLTRRARARPLVWPSGTEFVSSCLPGPERHAAV